MNCKHGIHTGTMSENRNHMWSVDIDQDSRRTMVFITCPRKFAAAMSRDRVDELGQWVASGYATDVVVWGSILWVLAPDPGCEL